MALQALSYGSMEVRGEAPSWDSAVSRTNWTSGASPRFIALAKEKIFYASEQSAVLGSNSMKIVSLELKDGQETKSYSLKTDDTLCTVSCADLAFTSWYDKSSNNINVNLLGSSKIHTLALGKPSGDEIEGVTIVPSCGPESSSHFLVHVQTPSGGWAEIFHIAVESGEVNRAYRLPYVGEKDAFAASSVDGKVYFARITNTEIVLYSASSDVIARWPRSEPSRGGPSHAKAEVVLRGQSGFAIRVAEVSIDGEWTLMRNGELVWSRSEMLADVVAAAWADDLPQEALAHDLDLEGHENPVRAYVHRLNRHLRDLQYFSHWLQQLPLSIMSGLLTSKSEAEKGLLGSKSLIVATSKGQYFALDPVNAGAIKWRRLPRLTSQGQQAMSLYIKDGIATSYVSNLGVITLNATDGRDVSFDESDAHFTRVAIAPGPRASVAYRILRDGQPQATATGDAARDGTYLVTQSESGSNVQGWMVGESNSRLWTFSRGDGYHIANVVARPTHDPVSSIGKVLGDRSVLYKYLSPNLALITSIKADTLTIDLLDSITGTILYSTNHKSVDTKAPIPSVISENWFAYSFFGNEHPTSPSKSHQLVIVELYESSIPNDRGPLQSSSNYSSFDPGSTTKPHIITQSFIIPQPIGHMSVTQTAQGITSRQLLCTLPDLNAIVAIPRHILDPRRPIGRDPTPHEAEEGLFRYSPLLDLDPKYFLSHAREVMGIKKIISSPTLLESTSMVFAFGLDVFGTRVTPSKAFDVLGKGFNKIALILTVVALAVGTAVLAPMVRRKQVERGWKM
jgi:ER membrane protein complex subunit 1